MISFRPFGFLGPGETDAQVVQQIRRNQERVLDTEYLVRLNYGLAAVKQREVCVVEGFKTHVFHLILPPYIDYPPMDVQLAEFSATHMGNMSNTCIGRCDHLISLFRANRRLADSARRAISRMTSKIYSLIPDVTVNPIRRRPTRGLFDFIGRASKWLFGTATEGDTNEMLEDIRRIKSLTGVVAEDAARTREGMATFTRLSNARLDTMHDLMAREHKTLIEFITDAQTETVRHSIEMSAVGNALTEITEFMNIHDNVQELEIGVADMIHGQLTPFLISTEDIREVLRNLSSARDMPLCAKTSHQVYESRNFEYARSQRDLFIKLHLPFTRHEPMSVYKTRIFKMQVPGKQEFVTQLSHYPQVIIFSSNGQSVGELQGPPTTSYVDSSEIVWHEAESCVSKLITDTTTSAHEICAFTARRDTIEPSWLRLSQSVYVLSNLTDVSLICTGERKSLVSSPKCALCLTEIACGCRLFYRSERKRLITSTTPCRENASETSSISHSVNLAVLKHFYDLSNTTILSSELFNFSQLRRPEPLDLPVFEAETERLLAQDQAASYSLSKLATSMRNGSVVLHSASEAFLYDLLKQQRHRRAVIEKFDALLVCVSILAVVSTGLIFILSRIRRRVEIIAAVVLGAANSIPIVDLTNDFEWHMRQDQRPTSPPSKLLEDDPIWGTIRELRMFETLLIVAVSLVVVLLLVITWIAVKRSLSKRSFLYIELTSSTECVHLRLLQFPNASRYYGVKADTDSLRVTVKFYGPFCVVHFGSNEWFMWDLFDKIHKPLPSRRWMSVWTGRKIRRITTSDNCSAAPLIIHSHEYIFPHSGIGRSETAI